MVRVFVAGHNCPFGKRAFVNSERLPHRLRRIAMSYDLTDLRLFVAIAEEGNLTRGAARAFLAPSSASHRLRRLEDALHTTLFERQTRGVALTPAGEALLRNARQVLASLEQLHANLSPFASGLRGHCSCGSGAWRCWDMPCGCSRWPTTGCGVAASAAATMAGPRSSVGRLPSAAVLVQSISGAPTMIRQCLQSVGLLAAVFARAELEWHGGQQSYRAWQPLNGLLKRCTTAHSTRRPLPSPQPATRPPHFGAALARASPPASSHGRSTGRICSRHIPAKFGLGANGSMAAAGRNLQALCRAAFSLASATSTSAAAPAALAQLSLRGGAAATAAASSWGGLQQHAAAAAGLRQLARVSGQWVARAG